MKTKFYSDIQIEAPYYHQVALKLQGVRRKNTWNGSAAYDVTCPKCKRDKAILGLDNHQRTYVLACPCSDCVWRGTTYLNKVIQEVGDTQMKKDWWNARNRPVEQWFPIKNRRLGEKKKRHIPTFKEKMQLKSDVLRALMLSGN